MSLDPTIGRWISEDPIGFQAADANLYRDVGNDPTNETDPSGLTGKRAWLWMGMGAAIGGLAGPPTAVIGGIIGYHLGKKYPLPLELDANKDDFPQDQKNAGKIKPVVVKNVADVVKAVGKGKGFKWVVTLDRELRIVEVPYVGNEPDPTDPVKHTIASDGAKKVLAAGWGMVIDGETVKLDYVSGHYHGEKENTEVYGVPAFKRIGFETIEIVDRIIPKNKKK